MNNKEEVKITWRGWSGHSICAYRCLFRLNTLLEYKNIKIVVSTIGLKMDASYPNKISFEEIGCGRHFETMAFHAEKKGKFWDADILREVDFDSKQSYKDTDNELEANEGHYKVIEEIKEKLLKNQI